MKDEKLKIGVALALRKRSTRKSGKNKNSGHGGCYFSVLTLHEIADIKRYNVSVLKAD